jgi:hypothetical protein
MAGGLIPPHPAVRRLFPRVEAFYPRSEWIYRFKLFALAVPFD